MAAIRAATEIANAAFERFAQERVLGRTERELQWQMNTFFNALGAEGSAFPTIVAAGANGANPHTTPGDHVVEEGETVIVDAGAVLDGYCSDCTRTFAAGHWKATCARPTISACERSWRGSRRCVRVSPASTRTRRPGT